MLCASITGPTLVDVRRQITQVRPHVDLIELRLDLFDFSDEATLVNLRKEFSVPMIFTLRSSSQGGAYAGSEEQRQEDLLRLAAIKPEYLDLESHVPLNFHLKIAQKYPESKLICSYHDFTKTPEHFEALYRELKKRPAALYKLAFMAASSSDALKLLCWAKNAGNDIIAISMGLSGQISRILGPVAGSKITYACVEEDQQTAPGQLSARVLRQLYRYGAIDKRTQIYGLIGNPVEHSRGHLTHNALMETAGVNAVYVKMPVTAEELPAFLHYAKHLPFAGLSVTMPLKETVVDYLDDMGDEAKLIGSVNTLVIDNGHITGYNTDGIGALNAIEKLCSVKGKRVVLIGAGGTAKAIAYEAVKRGAALTILNRDEGKAVALARRLHCKGAGLEAMLTCFNEGYDILINSTPVDLAIDLAYVIPGTLFMDVKSRPQETVLLDHARTIGCSIVPGLAMFIEQAVGQFQLWFKGALSPQLCLDVITENLK